MHLQLQQDENGPPRAPFALFQDIRLFGHCARQSSLVITPLQVLAPVWERGVVHSSVTDCLHSLLYKFGHTISSLRTEGPKDSLLENVVFMNYWSNSSGSDSSGRDVVFPLHDVSKPDLVVFVGDAHPLGEVPSTATGVIPIRRGQITEMRLRSFPGRHL